MQRYFSNKLSNNQFILDQNDSYHILTVMRMALKDQIEIIYEKELYICEIIDISNKLVTAKIIEHKEENHELEIEVTLVQSLVKEQKMDFILQKSVELGINKIIPLTATRSVVKIDKKETKKKDRWEKIIKEASEQSKRNIIPEITCPISIDDLTKLEYDTKILCTVNEVSMSIKKVLSNVKRNAKIVIVVGPEGGFTDFEEKKMIDNGFISTSLGNSVLRTETVGLYTLSVIHYHYMG